jgi:hypothetical protein
MRDLIIMVYGASGGPLSAISDLHAVIKGLRRNGKKIVADRKGPGARYRLSDGGCYVGRSDNRPDHRNVRGCSGHGGAATGGEKR